MAGIESGVFLLIVFLCSRAQELPTCQPQDFHYHLTNCEDGARWRISLPKKDVCVGGAPSPPKQLETCYPTCKPGEFHNITSLKCQQCEPGNYSVGDGVIYNRWDKMPAAFLAEMESFAPPPGHSELSDEKTKCTNMSAWQTKGSHIAFFGGPCVASLYLTVNLVRTGSVVTEYQYPDDDIIFEFQVGDDRCNALETVDDDIRWPRLTSEEKWDIHKVDLSPGTYKLNWRALASSSRVTKPLLIKSIQIEGAGELSECSQCPAGTYSNQAGSSQCTVCPANQISGQGSTQCKTCPSDHYANDEQTACLPRPPCTEADYYEQYSKCDNMNKTTVQFRWFEPKICRDDLKESEQLPFEIKDRECPPCNPGMEFNTDSGSCEFCQKGWYSDGVGSCRKCPKNTAPNTGLIFNKWNTDLPPLVEEKCVSFEGYGCVKSSAWQPKGDYIRTSKKHKPDVYLILSVKVDGGFKVNSHSPARGPVGFVSVTFETRCKNNCEFVFMTACPHRGINVVRSWSGTQAKQNFTFPVSKNDSYEFSWAFQREASDSYDKERRGSRKKHLYEDDEVRIYDIQIANTRDGGASSCIKCLKGAETSSCTICPLGRYFQMNTTECVACPEGTVATHAMPFSQASCEACADGLVPVEDRTRCGSDCMPSVAGVDYNITKIGATFKEVVGSRLFTTAGIQYSHVFNISLCGNTPVECKSNVSITKNSDLKSVKSLICRSTLMPSSVGDPVTTQAVSLGDILVGFSNKPVLKDIEVLEEFKQGSSKKSDLYVFYSSSTISRSCPKGRTTTVTLRCDPQASTEGIIRVPSGCPQGTCDGCTFHFLWVSASSCPVCSVSDYKIVKGECLSGRQVQHYIPSRMCQVPPNAPVTKVLVCSSHIPVEIQLVIVVAVAAALVLCLILVCVWKRTRRLEYKYMKLVASTKPGQNQNEHQGDADGEAELVGAESCALQEGEEEEVSVTIPVRSAKILHKIKSAYQKRAENGSFETIKLTADNKM